jgi:hypothetical protein
LRAIRDRLAADEVKVSYAAVGNVLKGWPVEPRMIHRCGFEGCSAQTEAPERAAMERDRQTALERMSELRASLRPIPHEPT